MRIVWLYFWHSNITSNTNNLQPISKITSELAHISGFHSEVGFNIGFNIKERTGECAGKYISKLLIPLRHDYKSSVFCIRAITSLNCSLKTLKFDVRGMGINPPHFVNNLD